MENEILSENQTTDENVNRTINNNAIVNEEIKTKDMPLRMCEPDKICDCCLNLKEKKCIVFFQVQVRICEECLIDIIIDKLRKYPSQNVKIVNGKRVFFLEVKSKRIKLYFNEIIKILPNNRKKELQYRLKEIELKLQSEIEHKCMVCGEHIGTIDSSVMVVSIDKDYNDKMSLFTNINYCIKNHFVCCHCYQKWLDQSITLNYKGNLTIQCVCALCKGVEHRCIYNGDITKLIWYDGNK